MNYNLGLSGGLDSKFYYLFEIRKFKFNTHIYGMKNFDRSIIARQIKKILNHEHLNITINKMITSQTLKILVIYQIIFNLTPFHKEKYINIYQKSLKIIYSLWISIRLYGR